MVCRNGTWDDQDIHDRWVGLAARLSMLQTHYREPINWTAQRLAESAEELHRWYGLLRDAHFVAPSSLSAGSEVEEALSDDLNTWTAITALRKAFKAKDFAALGEGMALLGLLDPYFVTAADVPVFARQMLMPQQLMLSLLIGCASLLTKTGQKQTVFAMSFWNRVCS